MQLNMACLSDTQGYRIMSWKRCNRGSAEAPSGVEETWYIAD